MPQRAKMTITPTGIDVQIEYNAIAIQAIKSMIDKKDRTYNADTRTWTFTPKVKMMVQQVLDNYYTLVTPSEEVRIWPQDREGTSKSRA